MLRSLVLEQSVATSKRANKLKNVPEEVLAMSPNFDSGMLHARDASYGKLHAHPEVVPTPGLAVKATHLTPHLRVPHQAAPAINARTVLSVLQMEPRTEVLVER